MCGQFRFDIRDNVATFDGQVEMGCLPMMGIAGSLSPGDQVTQLRKHMADMLRAYLREERYNTGEGTVTVTADMLWYRVRATMFAEGPDEDLCLPTYAWRPAMRSASD